MKRFLYITFMGLFAFPVLSGQESQEGQEWQQRCKTLPYAAGMGDELDYGHAVAVDGNYAVIGEPGFDMNRGCAYMLSFDGVTWHTIDTLTASDGHAGAAFGYDVAIQGEVVVVGSPNHSKIIGSGGMVYVFEKPEGGWKHMTETARLSASVPQSINTGTSVAISGDVIISGVPTYRYNDSIHGGVFVFEKEGAHWQSQSESAILVAAERNKNSELGISADICNDLIVAGARYASRYGLNSGEAMYWQRKGDKWDSTIEPTILDPLIVGKYDNYGWSVALSDSLIAVSSINYDYVEKNNGIVFIFEKTGSNWSSISRPYQLKPTLTGYENYFGSDLAVCNQTVLIGARQDKSAAYNAGAAYVFRKPAGGWTDTTETQLLTANDAGSSDRFGSSVGLSDSHIVVGAYDCDDLAADGGAAYFFSRDMANGRNGLSQDVSLSVFPNPSTGSFRIRISSAYIQQVAVLDLSGKEIIFDAEVSENIACVHMNSSPAGLYFLKLTTSEGTRICRIVNSK